MQSQKISAFGKNNFDRLEAAGVVGTPETDNESVIARMDLRIKNLEEVKANLTNLEMNLVKLHVAAKDKQLKMLTAAMKSTKLLFASKLPTGAKTPLRICLNELTSLREGVFTGAATDKKSLTILSCIQARKDIELLIETAKARKEKINAQAFDMQEFYDQAKDAIDKNKDEVNKLVTIKAKKFVIARVPLVPVADGLSVEKLTRLGFKVDNIANYASMHNQIVIGINPKQFSANPGAIKQAKMKTMIFDEADRLRKLLQKQLKTKLFFVSDTTFTKLSGTWYWLMTEKDITAFAKAFPSKHVKISRWGFAF